MWFGTDLNQPGRALLDVASEGILGGSIAATPIVRVTV
jgi:hypothetical protein